MNRYTGNSNKYYVPNPVKRFFRIADKTIVVIDDKIVRQLGVTENIWVEQIVTDEGIVLKVRKDNEEEVG
jgi:hypothetical protein